MTDGTVVSGFVAKAGNGSGSTTGQYKETVVDIDELSGDIVVDDDGDMLMIVGKVVEDETGHLDRFEYEL